jgi:hypothetical protein
MIVKAIFWLMNTLPGLAERFLQWQIQRANIDLEGFKTGAGFDTEAYKAWLAAIVEINNAKLAANAWWGAKLIILAAGLPCAVHLAAVILDSMPFYGHAVGQWNVARPPAPYDQYQRDIVLSFFIIAPAMPLISAASQWLGRKR